MSSNINNNNNLPLRLNSRRLVGEAPTKSAIEKALTNNVEEAPIETPKADEGIISWFDLDDKSLLEMKNIKIISDLKTSPSDDTSNSDPEGETENTDETGETGGAGGAPVMNEIEETALIDSAIGEPGYNALDDKIIHAEDDKLYAYDSGVYSINDLKEKYKFTDSDIKIFFEKNDDKYVIKKSAVKACFDRDDITAVHQLLDAIKNIGYTEGFIRGAYGFSAEEVDKYLTPINQNSIRYILNQNTIQTDFPDKEINTLGQLKEAIENNNITTQTDTTDTVEDLPSYTKDDLMNIYKFSSQDISVYFIAKDGKYVVKSTFVKECLSNQNVKTVEELLNCLKDAQYSEGIIKGLFGFNDDTIDEFFIVTNDRKYILNKEAIKKVFPDEDIKSLGQLKQAIQDYEYIPLISEEKKSQLLADIKTGFLNGDASWGFEKLEPSEEQVENLYKMLLEDEDIINFTGTVSEFKNLIKTKSAEFIKDIRDQITVFTQSYLKGRYGMPELALELFFNKDENGNYRMDMDKINTFWGEGYKRDNIEKLLDFINQYGLSEKMKKQACDLIIDALRNGDSYWGFNNLDPQLTEKEIQSFYSQIMELGGSGSVTLNDFEKLFRKNLLKILNNVQLERFDNMISGNELDTIISGNEVNEYINRYCELIKNDLKNNHGYSDKYIDEVLSFVIKDLNISNNPYNNYNLKDILTTLRFNINKITKEKPVLSYTDTSAGSAVQINISKLWEPNINYDSYMMVRYGDNIQTRFFGNLIQSKCNELGLTQDEINALFNIVLNKIGGTKDDFGYIELSVDLIPDINQNQSWFDDFYNVFSDELSKIRHMSKDEINNTTVIDTNTLFSIKNSLTAEDIINNFAKLKLSNDSGVRKLIQTIEDAFEKFNCFYDIDKTDLIKYLIFFINKKSGITNTNRPTLTNEAIEKLNKGNIFDEIQKIIDSQEFYIAYMVNVDGEINDFGQGSTKDCWLLSALKALASTPTGQQIIKNQITWADDYSSVTVYFAGIPTYVTISTEEILEAIEEGRLSSGDNDVLIIELAMQKVYGDINYDYSETFWSRFIGNINKMGQFYGNTQQFLSYLLMMKNAGNGFAATFSLHGHSTSINCQDGSSFSYDGDKNHALAITDITATTVTFINPWDSNKEYTVSWEEFAKLGAYRFDTVSF